MLRPSTPGGFVRPYAPPLTPLPPPPPSQLGLHRRPDGSIDKDAFKVVYVAPMKALVAEMVGNFSKRLTEAYGINVRELTGRLGGRGIGEGGGAAHWGRPTASMCASSRQVTG